ncbi:flagellar export chaperone FliS [Paenibacillus cellulositrophicus]|uniref:flagellar export chaperone FliS n=1 Tax=Paenibacillus cellulositrophicus TaxID=562959 RepID=UPI003F7F0829
MITSPYDKYRQSSVQTSPNQLLLMLFDGAIRFTRLGIEGLGKQDFQAVNTYLGKSQTIVSELLATLDYSYDVSKKLASLYDYIKYLLIEANIKKSIEQAEEALGYLVDLRNTFGEAAKISSHTLGQGLSNG